MSVYQEAGVLIIGSRLKRLSERFLSEVSRIYKLQNIHFEPAWFPVFFLIDNRGTLSLTEISQELDVSHSAISQMITQLLNKKLVEIQQDDKDARIKKIALTEKGSKLLEQVHPVWEALQKSMVQIWPGGFTSAQFLDLLGELENKMAGNFLSETTLGYLQPEAIDVIISIPDASLEKKLKKWIASENVECHIKEQSLLIASHGTEISGFAAYIIENESIIIKYLFVKKSQRRKGIGSALLQYLSQHYQLSTFGLDEGNMDLIRVLLKTGFSFKVK